MLVVPTLGSVEAGSLDQIGAIAIVARKYGCWLHVDAAIGGYFMLCEQFSDVRKGEKCFQNSALKSPNMMFCFEQLP